MSKTKNRVISELNKLQAEQDREDRLNRRMAMPGSIRRHYGDTRVRRDKHDYHLARVKNPELD